MEVKPNCGNCKYYLKADQGDTVCRRHPPTWVLMASSGKMIGGPSVVQKNSQHPSVQSIGWCGEHVPKVAVEQ